MYQADLGVALLVMERETEGQVRTVQRAFVTTDIVGSTPLVCRLGDKDYQLLIEAHDDLLIEALVLNGGEYFRSCGDGMLVSFDCARSALEWAFEVQRAVFEQLDVQIRVGAHFGPVRFRSPGYIGKSLHVVARIAALAGADEVLVSQALYRAAGLGLAPHADRVRLRGLDRAVEIVSLSRDDLPTARSVFEA